MGRGIRPPAPIPYPCAELAVRQRDAAVGSLFCQIEKPTKGLPMYSYRDLPREAASRAARIHLDALDKLVARHGMGGKRGGARVFSIRDLVIANTARSLAGPPITLAEALAIAAPLLADEPAEDAVLIHTDDGRSWIQRREDDWPETSFRLVPIGQFTKDIGGRLGVLE